MDSILFVTLEQSVNVALYKLILLIYLNTWLSSIFVIYNKETYATTQCVMRELKKRREEYLRLITTVRKTITCWYLGLIKWENVRVGM